MFIICEHVYRIERVASVPKAPIISYSRISYFGDAYMSEIKYRTYFSFNW